MKKRSKKGRTKVAPSYPRRTDNARKSPTQPDLSRLTWEERDRIFAGPLADIIVHDNDGKPWPEAPRQYTELNLSAMPLAQLARIINAFHNKADALALENSRLKMRLMLRDLTLKGKLRQLEDARGKSAEVRRDKSGKARALKWMLANDRRAGELVGDYIERGADVCSIGVSHMQRVYYSAHRKN